MGQDRPCTICPISVSKLENSDLLLVEMISIFFFVGLVSKRSSNRGLILSPFCVSCCTSSC